jgi:cyanophycinase
VGNVSRAVAVVAARLAPNAVAVDVDEGTRLGPAGRVAGTGRVWHVTPDTSAASGVLMRAQAASQ